MHTFFYVDAPAGSGKTYSLSHFAVARARAGEKIVIAQPTKRLLRQTRIAITGIDSTVSVTMIAGSKESKGVVHRLAEFMDSAVPGEGQVLLITHEGLRRMSRLNRKFWHLAVDEIPAVFTHEPLKIRYTHGIISGFLSTEELLPGITSLGALSPQKITDVIERSADDQNYLSFVPLLNAIKDESQLVCVNTEKWNALTSSAPTKGQTDFFLIRDPEFLAGFASTTLMGANATASEMFVIWDRLFHIKFVPHPDLKGGLYDEHMNGHRLTLHWCFDRWSKRYSGASNSQTGEDSALEVLEEEVASFFDSRDVLWQANEGVELDAFDLQHRLPHVPHGIDHEDYRKVHSVALMSAVNRQQPAFRFLEAIGIAEDDIIATLAYQNEYQAMMRCSLRDPNATAPVDVIVMTQGSAEWIGKRFPGCTIKQFNTALSGPGKNGVRLDTIDKPKKSRAEIQKAYRARQKDMARAR